MEVHSIKNDDIVFKMLMTIALVVCFGLFMRLYRAMVWEPKRLRSLLKKQGIGGPPPKFLVGNLLEMKKAKAERKPPTPESSRGHLSHNCTVVLFPVFDKWRKQYGPLFMFALGNLNILYVDHPDMVKHITTYTSLDLGRPTYQQRELGPLLGQGILTSSGAVWSHQRKILAPELYMDKVKGMLNIVTESALALVVSWSSRIDAEGGFADINIDKYMRNFSGDVISRACFGGNYAKGEEIFLKLRALQEIATKKGLALGIPGMRYLPTKNNRESWALQKEVHRLILKVVKERKEAGYEKDLLQVVLESAEKSDSSREETDRFIVDNCKNIYLAGYETTAVSSTWTLMLLASNPEWQTRVRDEVLDVCKGQIPSNDMLLKMKQLTMVIHESLRLYSPVPVISREALADLKLGDLRVPKGFNIWSLIYSLHTDNEVWGQDAHEFNPHRFENGIKGACKYPQCYLPFGVGPRVCLGQNLAIIELKVLISLLVSKFSFALSPEYVHSPVLRLVIEPENGVRLLVKKL